MNGLVEFTNVAAFAQFIAELVRQGVTFRAHEHTNGEFHVHLLGGY